jgi:DNA-binding response OmpR family regulator
MTRRDAKTLLIADDDHDLVSILSIRCRLLGLKVFTAFDAFTALSLVRSTMPDLVCLDVGMPAGNGLSVCEMITSDATFREIPVIILTGRSDPQTICRCHSMCAYYVEKSTDTWERLEPLIRELLEIPSTVLAEPVQKCGDEAHVDLRPASVLPNLSALVGANVTEGPIAPCADSAAEPTAQRVPLIRMDASHPHSADPYAGAIGSLDAEPKEPHALPDWETWVADRSQVPTPTLLAQTPTARTADEDGGTLERPSTQPASEESAASSEAEAIVEPSSMWRQFAQVVGRVVGRAPEEREKGPDASGESEDSASQTDVSQPQAAPPKSHDSVTRSVGSTPSVESAPTDAVANEQDRQEKPLASTSEEEGDDRWTGGRTHQAAPLAELDQVWSLVGHSVAAPRTTEPSPDHVAQPIPTRRPPKNSKAKKPVGQEEKTLLIADDDCDLVQMLVLRCTQLGLRVFRSPDAMHALLGAHRVQPDLVILDVNMPGGNGLSVCEMMAGDPALARTPVIIMTGDANEEIPRRCQALHAEFLQKGPGLWERLEPLIRKSLGMPPAIAPKAAVSTHAGAPETERQPRILCIDDDPEISKLLKIRLEPYGVDVLRAFKGMQGYWTALDMRPDLIILDMVMPDGGGNYILGRLRAHPLTEKTPVLILTGINTPGVRRQMFGMGVDAYLTKPLDFDDLIEHVSQYVRLREPGETVTASCR